MRRSAMILWSGGFALVVFGWVCVMSARPMIDRIRLHDDLEIQGMMPSQGQPVFVEDVTKEPSQIVPRIEKPTRLNRNPIPLPNEHAVSVPVLMYHYVRPLSDKISFAGNSLSVTPEHFESQMKELVDGGYTTVTPDQLNRAIQGKEDLPAHPVLITFDDGYRDQYMHAFPILFDKHLKATFFIITDYVTGFQAYMDIPMMKVMEHSGVATIASHTKSHAMLGKYSDVRQQDEIFDSKKTLESLFGHPINTFAYPYGSFTTTTQKFVQDAGYTMAFSTIPGTVHVPHALYELRRIRVMNQDHLVPLIERMLK